MALWTMLNNLKRKKILDSDVWNTPLQRCLTTVDLTLLGLANMIGGGVFVLGGTIAHSTAGPGVILSFLIAGLAAFLSALCYAEFGSLIPRTGSAYLFTYVILGEAVAFTAGWAVVSEQIIGIAATARAFSGAVDNAFNGWVQNKSLETFGNMEIEWMNPYPDFLALVPIILINGIVVSGVKNTSLVGNALTALKIILIVIIVFTGFTRANFSNWENEGTGGFLPYGINGVFSGSAYCFFAYVGFESIAIAGEEANTPKSSIPKALMISMCLVTVLYTLSCGSLTLMQPYYDIDPITPFQKAFTNVGLPWVNYIVIIGSLLAFSTTIMCNLYATARIMYAMASDGMIWPWIGKVHISTKAPVNATVITAVIASMLALFLNMEVLIELFSFVTLLAFTLVAVALLKFHYQIPDNSALFQSHLISEDLSRLVDVTARSENIGTLRHFALYIPLIPHIASILPIDLTIVTMVICQIIFGVFWVVGYHTVGLDNGGIIVFLVMFGTLGFTFFCFLALHHTNNYSSGFRVPLSPLPEALTISVNLCLMFTLKPATWARFTVWFLVGVILYFLYGARNSKERDTSTTPLMDDSHVGSDGGGFEYHSMDGETPSNNEPNNYGALETLQ